MTTHTATPADLAAVDAAAASAEATHAYRDAERAMHAALDLPHSNPRRTEAIRACLLARDAESAAARALTAAERDALAARPEAEQDGPTGEDGTTKVAAPEHQPHPARSHR